MIIPVRCMTCGRAVGGLWEKYKELLETGKNSKEALDELGIKSACCRALFLTHRDNLRAVSKFKP